MKYLLTIGSSHWLTDSASTAGKIADLVAKLEPVDVDYATQEAKSRHIIKATDWRHEVRFETEKSPVVTPDEFQRIKAAAVTPGTEGEVAQ